MMKTTEGGKRGLVVRNINNEILSIYPFLTIEERAAYEYKAAEILACPTPDPFKAVNQLLGLLCNPHATIYPIKESVSGAIKVDSRRPTWNIEDKILYIRIPSWSKSLIDLDKDLIRICIEHLGKYEGIILDVRENKGGNSTYAYSFAGIFFREDIEFGKVLSRGINGSLEELPYVLPANKEIYLNNPIVVLISGECFSTNELFLAPFKVSRRAVLMGEKTAGGSANPLSKEVEINEQKYCIKIPRHRFFLKGENKPLEETAIVPDVVYTQQDIVDFAKKQLREQL